MKELEDSMMQKLTPLDRFETNKKYIQDKVIDLEGKISVLD